MSRWPHDDMESLVAFYGDPNDANFARDNLVTIHAPWNLIYDGRPWKAGITVHKKCSIALQTVLSDIWDHFSRDQENIDAVGMSEFDGSYNNRDVRGRPGVKSVHAFGAAFDFDAKDNALGVTRGAMDSYVINAWKKEGATWGGDFVHRKDWMHTQFACEGAAVPLAPVDTDPVPPEPKSTDAGEDAPSVAPSTGKSLIKSKIAWLGTGSGVAVAGDVANQASDALATFNSVKDGVHQTGVVDGFLNVLDKHPRFLMGIVVVLALVAVVFFRWFDFARKGK